MAKSKSTKSAAGGPFIALTGVQNDKTGARFEAGDEVKAEDFPAAVLADWLKIGVLKTKKGSKS